MSVDDQSLVFSSQWEILRIIQQGEVTVSVPAYPNTTLLTSLSGLGLAKAPIVAFAMTRDSGATWHLSGGGLYAGGVSIGPMPSLIITSNEIRINNSSSGGSVTVRYWVFNGDIQA